MLWKCLIVDDDPVQCELLTSYCNKVDAIGSVEMTMSGLDALKRVEAEQFDLMFLDLKMPEISGKEILELLPPNLPVVMVTSDTAFAVESYNYNVVGYVVKPITLGGFLKVIERLKDQLVEPEFIFVKEGTARIKIHFNELLYIKSESNYVAFYTESKRVMSLMRLTDLETQLPGSFLRVHRSFIVNTNFIQHISARELKIKDTVIPISASFREAVSSHFDLS
ncbi:MAG: response regulator transcription factor [Flavobacteriales bacterium]|nr:response regulator transcription factor [Flavobacteriales bacterium]